MTFVLILDDRASDRDVLSTVLGYAGYRTLESSSGHAALELARAERPDLIIADILMPDMDGYEFVQLLRLDEALAPTPVIFCTATYNIEEVRRLAAACGVTHVMVKPAEPKEIVRIVGEALGSTAQLP